jgi:acetoin utilization deacetylase AcuC-like enzyme
VTTYYYTHLNFLNHDTGPGHPESADRLRAISTAFDTPEFAKLVRKQAPAATREQLRLVHPQAQIDRILQAVPSQGYAYIDGDTVVSPGSGEAALHAVGAVCAAVDAVLKGEVDNAFCAVRPPGHHAEPGRSMGFCLFNNVAIAAEHARSRWAVERVAIVDFDVHHGNGTQAAFYEQPNVLYASTHQSPLYPGTGRVDETGVGNIFNVPLAAGSDGKVFRKAVVEIIFPALHAFKPELILISAGFDAHREDPLASLRLGEEDFAWISRELLGIADTWCRGRVVSTLEGGYHLGALGRSAAAHVREFIKG